jgi:hypothetical protein
MALIRNEDKIYREDKQVSTAKGLWWFVIVRGGLIIGLFLFMPANIIGTIFLDTTNGTWLFPYNRFVAEDIKQWTDGRFILGRALLYFTVGAVCGFILWVLHRTGVGKEKTYKGD